ncbi:MAG: hydrogenase maturation nickel metallochaperone HypA [Candidatus Bipolaricaulia bacterium]
MHEYSLAKELISTLTEQVSEDKLTKTEKVHLELGELRVISKEALSHAFEIITEDTVLKNARLEFEDVLTLARCKNCEFEGRPDYDDDISLHFSLPILSCPSCGSSVEVVRGDELSVKSLTIEDER